MTSIDVPLLHSHTFIVPLNLNYVLWVEFATVSLNQHTYEIEHNWEAIFSFHHTPSWSSREPHYSTQEVSRWLPQTSILHDSKWHYTTSLIWEIVFCIMNDRYIDVLTMCVGGPRNWNYHHLLLASSWQMLHQTLMFPQWTASLSAKWEMQHSCSLTNWSICHLCGHYLWTSIDPFPCLFTQMYSMELILPHYHKSQTKHAWNNCCSQFLGILYHSSIYCCTSATTCSTTAFISPFLSDVRWQNNNNTTIIVSTLLTLIIHIRILIRIERWGFFG